MLVPSLLAVIKPVVTERHEVDYGDGSKPLAQVENSHNQKSGSRIRTFECFSGENCTSFMISIVTLLKENRSVFMENFKRESRDRTKLIPQLQSLEVVYKKAFDAKSRGRSEKNQGKKI